MACTVLPQLLTAHLLPRRPLLPRWLPTNSVMELNAQEDVAHMLDGTAVLMACTVLPLLLIAHLLPRRPSTGMRASVHVDLPGWTKEGLKPLQDRCEELHLQPRGTRGESGGQTGITYDISNKHRLGYSEVQLVQKMIDGVNTLVKEDR